ncbi:MAG: hypothetical protein AAF266_05305 [Planctomycetota bacterium]
MTRQLGTSLVACAIALIASQAQATIITDTFSRTTDPGWGMVDNGSVGGTNGTVAAGYALDGGVTTDGATGVVSNNRVVLDYNLATDPSVIAGGGFVVEWRVNPTDGDVDGTGREFAGIGISDSNTNPPYGGAGAITNGANTTLRYALLPQNSGSVGRLTRTAGNVRTLTAGGIPGPSFSEIVFDQPTFDAYAAQDPLPDPFVNDTFYDVRIEVLGDFTAASPTLITSTVNGVTLPTETIEWGAAGQAYVSAVAFNGPHQYDDLRISAIPEPTAGVLALLALTAFAKRRA